MTTLDRSHMNALYALDRPCHRQNLWRVFIMKQLKVVLFAAAVAALAVSCAKLPQADVDAANAAFTAATQAQAEVYAPESFKAASDANAALTANLTAKDYGKTKALAAALLDASNKAKTDAAAHGITLSTHLKFGHAGSEIIALAEKIKADLIIVGSHGKSQTDRLLIGSVSTFIVTHSRVSTMVVRS